MVYYSAVNSDSWVVEDLVDKGKFLFTEAFYLIHKEKKKALESLISFKVITDLSHH